MRRRSARHPGWLTNVRILICDEQTLVLAGLRTVLSGEPDLEIVSEAQSAAHAIELTRTLRPDIVLLGVPLTDASLVTTVRRLTAVHSDGSPRVMVISSEKEEEGLLDALRAGVRGVVNRNCSAAELLHGVRVVAAGEAALTPWMTGALIDFAMSAQPGEADLPPAATALTKRELEVLTLVAQGLSDAQIAETLWVSKATIRSHVHHVMGKLGLSSRAQAVAYYYQHGLARTMSQRATH